MQSVADLLARSVAIEEGAILHTSRFVAIARESRIAFRVSPSRLVASDTLRKAAQLTALRRAPQLVVIVTRDTLHFRWSRGAIALRLWGDAGEDATVIDVSHLLPPLTVSEDIQKLVDETRVEWREAERRASRDKAPRHAKETERRAHLAYVNARECLAEERAAHADGRSVRSHVPYCFHGRWYLTNALGALGLSGCSYGSLAEAERALDGYAARDCA